jgi:sialic acid synthase SpsE
LSPEELGQLVRQIRDVEAALGSPVKQPAASELPVRALVRRSVTAARPIQAGQAITDLDVVLLRPGTGIQPRELPQVLGKLASHDIDAGATLHWSDLR